MARRSHAGADSAQKSFLINTRVVIPREARLGLTVQETLLATADEVIQ
jgi:hypothetical protein